MLKIPAHADALSKSIECRLRRPSLGIVELHALLDPIANSLNPRPPRRRVAKELVRDVPKAIDFAIAAAEEKHQRLGRKITDWAFARQWFDWIGTSTVEHQGRA